MTGELKSMFDSHLEPISDLSDKQRIEYEEKKKKEFYKKQSNLYY